jgi:hypothetical protein
MRVEHVNKANNEWYRKVIRVLSDPYYYALTLPSFLLLFFSAVIFLVLLAIVMAGLWFSIRTIAYHKRPSFDEMHPSRFLACACVAMMPLVAGFLSRRMTRAEIRGKFVHFSKRIAYRNGHFVFSVIDMRKTQLIGTNVVVEVIAGLSDAIACRRVDVGRPGIIAIPTEVRVPVGEIFPSLKQVVSCDICGRSSFRSFKAYSLHMSYHHGIARTEASEDILRSLEAELANLRLLRVVLTGTDEVSGKTGMSIKEYKRGDIVLGGTSGNDDAFSIRTMLTDEQLGRLSSDSSSSKDDGSTTLSVKSNYVHVDFKSF